MNEREIRLNDEFAQALLVDAAEKTPQEPLAFYNEEGDCIEFLFSDESYYAERIDDLLTVYYGRESGEIIGSLIKGVKNFVARFVEDAPGFVIEVHDGKILLDCIFTAGMWQRGDEIIVKKYKKLRDAAARMDVEVEIPMIAN